jgi:hypothetical protein
MKTNEVSPGTAGVSGILSPERKGGEPDSPVGASDRATLAQTDKLNAAISANVNVAATERAQRIHTLTQMVRAGVYRPNPSQLAEQILAEAEFDAHLERVLG